MRSGNQLKMSFATKKITLLRVCSIRNLDLDFKIRISGSAIEREIRKQISTLRYLFLDFLFTVRLGNPKRDLKNCP